MTPTTPATEPPKMNPLFSLARASLALAGPALLALALCAAPARAQAGDPSGAHGAEGDSLKLGGEFTLLPENLGRPSKGLEKDADLRKLASVAVLHEGRVKPLETMARHVLTQWSGRDHLKGRSALSTMAEILFAPEKTGSLKLFRIDNPEVAQAMGIAPEKNRLYTYRQIESGLEKLQGMAAAADTVEEAKRDLVQKEALRTFANVAAFLNLTRTAQFALPSGTLVVTLPDTRRVLDLGPGPTHSFWELMVRAPRIAALLDGAGRRGALTPIEAEVVRLSRAMYLQSQSATPSLLRALPAPGEPGKEGMWLSPGEVIADAATLQKLNPEVGALAAMSEAYRAGDAPAFDSATTRFNDGVRRIAAPEMARTRFGVELLENRIDPLFKATVLFWIATFITFLYFLFRRRWIYASAWVFAGAALLLLIASIVARILIMHRPPVTSLFETFPFVAAVSITVALFLESRSRQAVALLASTLLGTILLTIATRYAADGDTMQMLVAVLNSNFWLSTHVVCITTGYAACALAGAIAHIRLVRGAWSPVPSPEGRASLREIDRMVFGTICFGLLFSFIGTVLGGIWADQSWGRFWGWDPKENGALLIVLWCAILLHARHWGVIRETGLAAGAVLGAVVVSLAWEGVNLLNVGLHSYGFTSGAAVKLFSYIGAEIAFLLAMWGLTLLRRRRAVS